MTVQNRNQTVTNERPAVTVQDPTPTGATDRRSEAVRHWDQVERDVLSRASVAGLLEEMAAVKSRLGSMQWQQVREHAHCHCELCSDEAMGSNYTVSQCGYMRAARELRRRYQVGQIVRVRSPYYGLAEDATIAGIEDDGLTVTFASGVKTYAPFHTVIK